MVEMDEILTLRALRAEVPAGDAAARLTAATALGERMRAGSSPARARRRFAIPALAVSAVALALLASVGVGRDPGTADAAAMVLRQAAQKLGDAPAAPLGAGQYWYVESRGLTLSTGALADDGGSYSALVTTVHKLWIARDGSGRIVRTDADPQWLTPADRERWEAAGSPAIATGSGIDEPQAPGSMVFPFGGRSLTYAELRALPSDADLLAPMVEHAAVGKSWSLAWQELDLIAELLRNAPLSPQQGAALYEVASRLPGIELVGPTHDSTGRPGMGIAVASNGFRQELVLDPASGRLLGEFQTSLEQHGDLAAGTLIEAVSYVSSGVVEGTGAAP
jgi:hypothetical protein